MRQANILIMRGPVGQGREVDFILNVGGSHRKAFFFPFCILLKFQSELFEIVLL